MSTLNLIQITLTGSPKACTTLGDCPDVNILGCGGLRGTALPHTSKRSTTTTTTTVTSTTTKTTTTTTRKSTTTQRTSTTMRVRPTVPKRKMPPIQPSRRRRPQRPLRPIITTSTVIPTIITTTEDSTAARGFTSNDTEPTTPAPQQSPYLFGMSEDVVITLSVLVPTLTILGVAGGYYCYIQYRKKKGLKYGWIPCKKKDRKLKDSDENINVSANAGRSIEEPQEPSLAAAAAAASLGPCVSTLADTIEQLGATGGDVDGMEEIELYSAHPTSTSILPPTPPPADAMEESKLRLPPPIPVRRNPPPAVPQRIPPGPTKPHTEVRTRIFYPRKAKDGARPKYGGAAAAAAEDSSDDDDLFAFDPAMTAATAQNRM